jgi:hypothetical protein
MTYTHIQALLSGVLAQAGTDPSVLATAEEKGGIMGAFLSLSDAIMNGWLSFLDWFGAFFAPVMKPVFTPINNFIAPIYQPWAQICALGLFIGTMVWVCFFLKREMLESGRENKALWTDLRLWTVLSMLPHLFVYIYFM